jgi:uncharacterized protein YndB with AHSA1/START domain
MSLYFDICTILTSSEKILLTRVPQPTKITRRRLLKTVVGTIGVSTFLAAGPLAERVFAEKSNAVMDSWPALLEPRIDGIETAVHQLNRTSLGESVSRDASYLLPASEWADARSTGMVGWRKGGDGRQVYLPMDAIMRWKEDEKWRYWQIEAKEVATFGSGVVIAINPAADYDSETTGDYMFYADLTSGHQLLYMTKGPFGQGCSGSDCWIELPLDGGMVAAHVATSNTFNVSHLICEGKLLKDYFGNKDEVGLAIWLVNEIVGFHYVWPPETGVTAADPWTPTHYGVLHRSTDVLNPYLEALAALPENPLTTPVVFGSLGAFALYRFRRTRQECRNIRGQIFIATPPTRVWSVITDLENPATWIGQVLDVKIVSKHRAGEGVEIRARTKNPDIFKGGEREVHVRVLEWKDSERFTMQDLDNKTITTYTLKPVEGGTVLESTTQYEVPLKLSTLWGAASGQITRNLRTLTRRDLELNKKLAET